MVIIQELEAEFPTLINQQAEFPIKPIIAITHDIH